MLIIKMKFVKLLATKKRMKWETIYQINSNQINRYKWNGMNDNANEYSNLRIQPESLV